jgi:hypothetical protein
MNYWEKLAAPAFPNATRLGRVRGIGPYALLSCKNGESRHITLFLDPSDRNRKLWKWDRNKTCGVAGCNEDHRMIDIGNGNELPTDQKTEQVPPTVRA